MIASDSWLSPWSRSVHRVIDAGMRVGMPGPAGERDHPDAGVAFNRAEQPKNKAAFRQRCDVTGMRRGVRFRVGRMLQLVFAGHSIPIDRRFSGTAEDAPARNRDGARTEGRAGGVSQWTGHGGSAEWRARALRLSANGAGRGTLFFWVDRLGQFDRCTGEGNRAGRIR